jgi:demethylmenaquinone methyltransferase / 2-methoxy-6-polyprenyl-1,4-benzoquinol methylase
VAELDRTYLPSGTEKAAAVRTMFDDIAPRYDLVNRLMTFRLDVRWRRRAVRDLGLGPGATVLDLACGTGDLCRDLSRAGHRPVGVDFSHGMLAAARTEAPLVQADVLVLPVPDGGVDGATCGFALRNLTALEPFAAELHRVLRPGGRIALLDAAEPENRVLRAGHSFYFRRVVPRIGAMLSKASAYRYLPASLSYLPPAEELTAIFTEAGFTDVDRRLLTGGAAQLLVATRGSSSGPARAAGARSGAAARDCAGRG